MENNMENTTKNIILTEKRVMEILHSCFYKTEEIQNEKTPDGCIKVEGIITNFDFNPNRINEKREEIEEMISDLPETFKEGWSFLNLCSDKNGNLWTGSHRTMEALMALGIAIDKIQYLLPREAWRILPGGMPYISVKTE